MRKKCDPGGIFGPDISGSCPGSAVSDAFMEQKSVVAQLLQEC